MRCWTGGIWELKVTNFISVQRAGKTRPGDLTPAKRRCPIGNSLFWAEMGKGPSGETLRIDSF